MKSSTTLLGSTERLGPRVFDVGGLRRRLEALTDSRHPKGLRYELGSLLLKDVAREARKAVRQELTILIHQVLDAKSEADAERALAVLKAHPLGGKLAELLGEQLGAALVYLSRYNRGLVRVGPEWLWRDFRQRVSRGRNHGSDARLERAALVWAIYANFTPAQGRKERKRKYKRPGKTSLELAGVPPGSLCYLDALRV